MVIVQELASDFCVLCNADIMDNDKASTEAKSISLDFALEHWRKKEKKNK